MRSLAPLDDTAGKVRGILGAASHGILSFWNIDLINGVDSQGIGKRPTWDPMAVAAVNAASTSTFLDEEGAAPEEPNKS